MTGAPADDERRTRLFRVLALLAAISISLTVFALRDHIPQLRSLGYLGVFLVTLLSNATIFLPVPGVMFTSLMGAVNNPLLTALAAGSGAALGELSAYLAGVAGRGTWENSRMAGRITQLVRRYGGLAIFLLAVIPNPLFDMAGMAAGALKVPLRRFLWFCWLGSLMKMLLFAYFGQYLGRLFL